MSSFNDLLSTLAFITEASSPLDKIIPGFQKQARGLAAAKGASSGTREGKLALLSILYELDIIDEAVVKKFKNDPSVSRLVDYFETNNISKTIKSRMNDIQAHIQGKLEDKISFTTGNRTDAAMQRMEVNKLNAEIKNAKRVARVERKKDTASALSAVSQVVDNYSDLVGSIESSYSDQYMVEVVADSSSDLGDIDSIVKYFKQFVSSNDIEVEGRSIDIIFSKDTKLGKIISRIGVSKVEQQIVDDLEKFGGAGVVIHEPDIARKPAFTRQVTNNIGFEDEEGDYVEEEDDNVSDADQGGEGFEGLAKEYEDVQLNPELVNALIQAYSKLGRGDGKNSGRGQVTESSVLSYMSGIKVYSSPKVIVESQSFRDKYKPKTHRQLAELRNYGM